MSRAILILVSFLLVLLALPGLGQCRIDAIYSFGDSLADTGNDGLDAPNGTIVGCAQLPYGETVGKATGRCSDGLLVIDYLAKALKLPLLQPYLAKDANFTHGVNFAVAGATALGATFFEKRGININNITGLLPNTSLDVQLKWFHTHLPSICSTKAECAEKLEKTIVLMGEIGINDFGIPLRFGTSIEEVLSFIPYVVQTIINAVQEVIGTGAVQIIVPGIIPIGCLPAFLGSSNITGAGAYDPRNCLKSLNNVSIIHNNELHAALAILRRKHPHALIMYADYYNAYLHLLDNAATLGFDESSLLRACCGGGGNKYNFDVNKFCGSPGLTACKDPKRYVSWDGVHLTQEANKKMAGLLIHGGYTHTSFDVWHK